jgi:uncharacterized membrane protein YphA (DoxX/SURF4 family)
MKKINIIYWVSTIIAAGLMLFATIPHMMEDKQAIEFMTGFLHYPDYFTFFIGIAKLLGIIAILVPGFPRIKEWAYAGLFFDLIGATYSQIAVGVPAWGPQGGWLMMLAWYIPLIVSYIWFHKKLRFSAAQ